MSPARMLKFENAIRIAIKFNENFNHHDATGMSQLLTETCQYESASPAPNGITFSGRQEMTAHWETYFKRFKDVTNSIEDIFSMGFHCVMQWRRTWVNQAREVKELRGVDIFKLKEGLISELRSYTKGEE